MPQNIYVTNRFSSRVQRFNRNNPTIIDNDVDQIISSNPSEKATEVLNSMSQIDVTIENPIINGNNLKCYLEYTHNINSILKVYKNSILITDYTFDKNSRYIQIPLSWNYSTYSISETDTLDNVIIYIETDAGECKINYSYN
jgi:hypothetical protein